MGIATPLTELDPADRTVIALASATSVSAARRLLNRTSRRFAMTEAGEEFYRHAVVMLRDARERHSSPAD